jgi:hypothetical protein
MMSQNNNSLFFYADELMGFLSSLNANRGGLGADKQTYLSIWSSSMIAKKNKVGDSNVKRPFMPFVSSGVLEDVIKYFKASSKDGFYERFLYALPYENRYDAVNINADSSIEIATFEAYFRKIFAYFEASGAIEVTMSEYVKPLLQDFLKNVKKRQQAYDESGFSRKTEMLAKVQTNFFRVLGVVWILNNFRLGSPNFEPAQIDYEISIADFKGASQIMEYFESTAMHIHDKVHGETVDPNALDKPELSEYRKKIALKLFKAHPTITNKRVAEVLTFHTPSGHAVPVRTVAYWRASK